MPGGVQPSSDGFLSLCYFELYGLTVMYLPSSAPWGTIAILPDGTYVQFGWPIPDGDLDPSDHQWYPVFLGPAPSEWGSLPTSLF